MAELITSDKSALFLQKGMGAKPYFRGLHTFTGDMTKADGAITKIFYWDAGEPIAVATTRAAPEQVTVTLDAPLQSIGDLVGSRQDCPINLIMITDNCLAPDLKRSWGRWGSTDPQIMLLISNAQIESRTLSNLMSREGGTNMPMGSVSIKFDTWILIKGGNPVSLTTVISEPSTIVGVAATTRSGCQDPECGGVEGCSVWWAAGSNGTVWKRNGNDAAWEQITLNCPAFPTHTGAIYADNRLVLVGGKGHVAQPYGFVRSIDGGNTWVKAIFHPGLGGTVYRVVRNNEDFFSFSSSGIWRSVDDGLTWTVVQAGVFLNGAFDDTGLGAAVTASNVYATRDAGLTWSEITTAGSAIKDVCFSGGYLYAVDSAAGTMRVDTNTVRNGTTVVWDVTDLTANVTDITFVNTQLGYRLRETAIDRTLNGGYSWETLSVSGSAPTWANMQTCGGRLGAGGGVYFGFYSPFFDSTNIARMTGASKECADC